MAVEGKGQVSACGHENMGIRDFGSFRDDPTGASLSVSEEEAEVDILSEGEDIMVGVSGAEIFFDGIYGPEGQEEDILVRHKEEKAFSNLEFCIDKTLEIEDSGLYEVHESAAAGAESDEIVSCVRVLVQSLPLPGQISPQELVSVNPQLVAYNDSCKKKKCDEINYQPSPMLKQKHESIYVEPKECSMPSRFQEFEKFLIASTKNSTAEDKMISQVEVPAQTREEDQNKNLQKQNSEEIKTELPGHSGCEASLVSSVKEVKDSYWPDMVIQTEYPSKLPTADTTTSMRFGKVFSPQSTGLGADNPNKRLRMETLKYNHAPVAVAPTNKNSPAELILTFDHMEAIPSESKLNNIFRRFGSLRETETLIYQGCARVVFKKSSDAEVAVSSAKAFNIMGPAVIKYELGYSPLTAMPAAGVVNTTSLMQSAEPEAINSRESEPEDMPAQQTQFEHLEETYEIDLTVESEKYEGLNYVDIMK